MGASDRLNFALDYARHGRRVFPCHTVRDGVCTCHKGKNCEHPGKHPAHTGWQSEATCDESVIKEWWAKNPDANEGVACGEKSNLTVLDVDGEAGRERLYELERE